MRTRRFLTRFQPSHLLIVVLVLVGGIAHTPTAWTAPSDVRGVDDVQEQRPLQMEQHPIVGAWFWQNISDDAFDDSYAVFGVEGTYVEETAYIGAGIGSWTPTGDHTADLIIVFQDIEGGLDPDKPAAVVPGTLKFWLSIDVSPDGNSLTATGPVEGRKADGTLAYAFTFNGSATRLGLDWVKPVGTPTA